MAERPNVQRENLLAVARRFGDALVAHERAVRAWERGQPVDPMRATSEAALAAEWDLKRAARAFATRMRRTKKEPAA